MLGRALGRGLIVALAMLMLGFLPANSAPVQTETPPSKLEVTIPDYVVTSQEGEDTVNIPGGKTNTVVGEPMCPYYTVSLSYPRGYVVQNIVLTGRSGLKTAAGLKIPRYIPEPDITGTAESSNVSGWFPDLSREFDWKIDESTGGGSVLNLAVFPFYYNTDTTEVRFYKNYSFSIDYISSNIEITRLALDKAVYEPGDKVSIELEINNSAEPQDVLVSMMLRDGNTEEIIEGLPLKKLTGLAGEASYSALWDSARFQPGYYQLYTELKDEAGNLLARRFRYFTLGTTSGRVTDFRVAPQHFNVGDRINISLGFENDGSNDLSGSFLVRIMGKEGAIVKELRRDFTGLAHGQVMDFQDVWDSTGSKEGSYRITPVVIYGGETTPPVSVEISTNYPPAARFTYLPRQPDLAKDVTFDASASADEDGKITSFDWDFGDGDTASGVTATYHYLKYGSYEVTLTIKDDKGATDIFSRLIDVMPELSADKTRSDINEDGIVNHLDLAILGAHYGENTQPPYPRYDINADGWVSLDDRDILIAHYGEKISLGNAK
jgi:hypothetical protein